MLYLFVTKTVCSMKTDMILYLPHHLDNLWKVYPTVKMSKLKMDLKKIILETYFWPKHNVMLTIDQTYSQHNAWHFAVQWLQSCWLNHRSIISLHQTREWSLMFDPRLIVLAHLASLHIKPPSWSRAVLREGLGPHSAGLGPQRQSGTCLVGSH